MAETFLNPQICETYNLLKYGFPTRGKEKYIYQSRLIPAFHPRPKSVSPFSEPSIADGLLIASLSLVARSHHLLILERAFFLAFTQS